MKPVTDPEDYMKKTKKRGKQNDKWYLGVAQWKTSIPKTIWSTVVKALKK